MIEILLKELREIRDFYKPLIKKFITSIVFRIIRRKAFKLHKKLNCIVYVVKIEGNVKIISKPEFKYLRQTGVFPLDFDADDLRKISLYVTPKNYDKKRV